MNATLQLHQLYIMRLQQKDRRADRPKRSVQSISYRSHSSWWGSLTRNTVLVWFLVRQQSLSDDPSVQLLLHEIKVGIAMLSFELEVLQKDDGASASGSHVASLPPTPSRKQLNLARSAVQPPGKAYLVCHAEEPGNDEAADGQRRNVLLHVWKQQQSNVILNEAYMKRVMLL